MNESLKAELKLEDMEFHAYHGWYEEEQKTGGKFLVSVRFQIPLEIDVPITRISEVINYEAVYKVVEKVMKEKVPLIEEVCRLLLHKIKGISSLTQNAIVEVTVTKCNPPIGLTKSSSFTIRS